MREGGMHAVHATIAYHENFREMAANVGEWHRLAARYADLIFIGRSGDDVRRAAKEGRTAIFFGFQNPLPIEDDISLIAACHALGVRFMQLSYNNQSLLASGCYETDDTGITRFGKEAIAEMNRVGLVVDMSHSGERSTMEAIELSVRPIAITHANPAWWHPVCRNKSDTVLAALAESGGMLGFSLYPHHLKKGSDCTLDDFCNMVGEAASRYGMGCLGIGSDLCQDQPDSIVQWMRHGRWSRAGAEDSADAAVFPKPAAWFADNRDFNNIAAGLSRVGFSEEDIAAVMGGNWLRFFDQSFSAAG